MTREEFVAKISGTSYISEEDAGKLYDTVINEHMEEENNKIGPYENSFERNDRHEESAEIIKRSLGLRK